MNNPRWNIWLFMQKATLKEAVALSLNIEPSKIQKRGGAWMVGTNTMYSYIYENNEEFKYRLKLLEDNLSNSTFFPTYCYTGMLCEKELMLGEFVSWATKIVRWEIPEALKGYPIEIIPSSQDSAAIFPKKESKPLIIESESDWKEQARIIADEFFDHDTKNRCRDSLKGYSKRVMEEMQKRGIKGPRGIFNNSNTIMRDALQGNLWWGKKAK